MEDYRQEFKNRRVLITGGLGFIGSNLAHALLEMDAKITIVDSLIPQYGGNIYNVEDIREKLEINLGALEPIAIADATKLLVEVGGSGSYEFVPFPQERKKIEIGDYWGNFSKIQNFFAWKLRVELREGLERTVHYYRKYKNHYWK